VSLDWTHSQRPCCSILRLDINLDDPTRVITEILATLLPDLLFLISQNIGSHEDPSNAIRLCRATLEAFFRTTGRLCTDDSPQLS
jgi:hypothetical protein